MALTKIEFGSLADPEIVNNNFEYLDEKITDASSKIYTNNATLESLVTSQVATVTNNLNKKVDDINTAIDSVENAINSTNNTLGNVTNYMIPNYTKRSVVNAGQQYTASGDGVVYARVPVVEGNNAVSITINGITFDLGSGLTNREGGHSSVAMFPVGKGDRYIINASTAISWFSAYFIPYKGKS